MTTRGIFKLMCLVGLAAIAAAADNDAPVRQVLRGSDRLLKKDKGKGGGGGGGKKQLDAVVETGTVTTAAPPTTNWCLEDPAFDYVEGQFSGDCTGGPETSCVWGFVQCNGECLEETCACFEGNYACLTYGCQLPPTSTSTTVSPIVCPKPPATED